MSDDPERPELEPEKESAQSTAVLWARYSQIAFTIPAAVLLGLLIGKLLDHWLHTRWLFLVGVIVGAVAGFFDMIRTLLRDNK